jgi:gamma-glutamyl:cysteine ligase YbdK (ATP-grasp superfamily)
VTVSDGESARVSDAPAPAATPLHLFEATGVELEYMIVDAETLDVRPVADRVFAAVGGEGSSDAEPDGPAGAIAWSNELARHVIELKTQRPAASLDGLAAAFQDHVQRIDALLEPHGCRLLPGGMHPWMNPHAETQLWPHECNEIYRTYDRIFGCRGHGWGNLQSTHLNLPFAGDDEFGRLMAAIRLVLPLLPALAASSPVADGKRAAHADQRMEVYRRNSVRVPLMAGEIVPEPVFTEADYRRDVLGRLYDALAPHDPEGTLRHEWANARGAIARFERGAIEIRVLDIQECPAADLAVAGLVIATVRALVEERWMSFADQCRIPTAPLAELMKAAIGDAETTRIWEPRLLAAFGGSGAVVRAGELWGRLAAELLPDGDPAADLARRIVAAGTLATRLSATLGETPDRARLRATWGDLADHLRDGRPYRVD